MRRIQHVDLGLGSEQVPCRKLRRELFGYRIETLQSLVVLKNSEPHQVRSVSADRQLGKIVWNIEGDENTCLAGPQLPILREDGLGLLSKCIDVTGLDGKYFCYNHAVSSVSLGHRVHCRQHRDTPFGS